MSERHAAEKNSDSVFSDLKVDEPPGFLFVDHIAIAVLSGELETQVRMYKQIGFRECQMFGPPNRNFDRRDFPLGTGKWIGVLYIICISETHLSNISQILERFWLRSHIFVLEI